MCRQEVFLLDNEISFNEAMIEEREQGIRDIQEEIGQANEIFKDLAVLVFCYDRRHSLKHRLFLCCNNSRSSSAS